eukprot:CAMPEP_0201739502 /NCGR_PEP_ID=MMETSP0593-20130828/45815_1 /ASSEMBLY_ACC=CAM_ASM_000672 /TAXON_ID=267983 /ORGANISM="Skeletonema japonicum, Strain CCMP2506" /LENGTH=562 /DNA_ID=CAMNT_0048233775 /DNA_START=1489 /DNA_END=3178 /DNA_ORIENTATION=-
MNIPSTNDAAAIAGDILADLSPSFDELVTSNPDIPTAEMRRALLSNVLKYPSLSPNLIVVCLYSVTFKKLTKREFRSRMGNVTIGNAEAQIVSERYRLGNKKKYFIMPDGENSEQVIAYDISVSGTRDDVDQTRGFMWRNKSFVDVNRSSNASRSVRKFLLHYHENRFEDGIDLADINDLSDGSSLVQNGRTYNWNAPPPNTTVNGFFAFRRELYDLKCSRETAVNVIRRAPTEDVTMLALLMRDQMREQLARDNVFREHMSELRERGIRLEERMDERTTAVEGTLQQHGGTLQQHGGHLQQLDQDVSVVMKELGDLRTNFRTMAERLDSEEARLEMERKNDDNQAVVAALSAPVSAAEANARQPPVRFVVEERFAGLKMIPEPGQGGFMEKEGSFIFEQKVVVGNEFSCHSRKDIVSLVQSFGGKVRQKLVAGVFLLLAGPNERKRINAANTKEVEVITTWDDLLNRLEKPKETRHETPAQSRSSNSRSADDISGTNINGVEVSREDENYDGIGEQDEVEPERVGYCDDCLRYWDEPGNRDCYTEGCRGNLSGRPWHPPRY